MKMVIAIVQNEDAYFLIEALMENEFSVTKLATTGGFLKVGNTTLLIGVEAVSYTHLDVYKRQGKTS